MAMRQGTIIDPPRHTSISSSYLTRHSFAQIGDRQPTGDDISHPAYEWDEQAVQSTNQRMEGLAINALLVQLYQPELLTTGPAAKVPSGKGFSGWRCARHRRREAPGPRLDRQGLPA